MLPTMYNSSRNSQNWFPSIFNEIFDNDFLNLTPAKQFASPAVNVIENEKDYQIELAAPGMAKGDFSIRLENENELSIKLEKKSEQKDEKKNYLRREFSYSSYQRSFIVPEEVDAGKITATMNDGVLSITLPKKEVTAKTPATRQIEIN